MSARSPRLRWGSGRHTNAPKQVTRVGGSSPGPVLPGPHLYEATGQESSGKDLAGSIRPGEAGDV